MVSSSVSSTSLHQRTCAFCGKLKQRTDMRAVTKNDSQRNLWFRRLGEEFRMNCEATKQPYLCDDHFPTSEGSNHRPLPYYGGSKHEFQESSDSDSEESLFDNSSDSNHELIDELIDPDDQATPTVFEHIICNWKLILPQISRCYCCLREGRKSFGNPEISVRGVAIKVLFTCKCHHKWSWVSSELIDEPGKRGPKQYQTNVEITAALIVTGNGYSKYVGLSNTLKIPHLSMSRYHEISQKFVRPAIESRFERNRVEIGEIIRSDGKERNLSGDGQYDSRGYSAYLCRFTLMDIDTKFIIDFETCRKKRGGNSNLLEKIAHEACLPRAVEWLKELTGLAKPVKSLTTDRCVNLSSAMKNFPDIEHTYDSWHWLRSVRKDILEVSKILVAIFTIITQKLKTQQFEPMKQWVQPFQTHCYKAIEMANGDGEVAYQTILSFFHHVTNVHSNFPPIGSCTFDKVSQCSHSTLPGPSTHNRRYLDLSNRVDKKAYEVFWDILNKRGRKEGLLSVSPHFATSSLESFHAVANYYLPKENFFDKASFDLRSEVAALHWNCNQLEELAGGREVVAQVPYYCKTKKKVVRKNRKARSHYKWRQEIVALSVGKVATQDDELMEIDIRGEVEEEMYRMDDI